jgi:AcrR family transcriptional regulator
VAIRTYQAKTANDDAIAEKGEHARREILEATIASFAEFGWNGTNMSTIARNTRMTRGKIQYYFPTLDHLLRAAVSYLYTEWQKRYFGKIDRLSDAPVRFHAGIDALWAMMDDPLHVARQELEACGRTNPELRALLNEASVAHDESSLPAAKQAYPELAGIGDDEVQLARHFTMVFMEGLSIYGIGSDADKWRIRLITMLKRCLAAHWSAIGVEGLGDADANLSRLRTMETDAGAQKRSRALALIQEATALLSE